MTTNVLERTELKPETVGIVIRLARQRKGLSQARVAEAAGLTQPMVSEIEKGRAQTLENLGKLAGALEMKLSRLIEAAEQMEAARGALKGFFDTTATLAEALDPDEVGALLKEAAGQ